MLRSSLVSIFILAFMALLLWNSGDDPVKDSEKIKGMNLEAPRQPVSDSCFIELTSIGNEWVAIIPYGFIGSEAGQVHFNNERQWWGEKDEGVRAVAAMARDHKQKIMIKPHVWIWRQGWPGDYLPANSEEWSTWEMSYRSYILNFAALAQDTKAEIFCIGTEFRKTARQRPEYWSGLIDEVREIYDGKITYAANWDNYEKITFWDKLDYIGIDAYFPLENDPKNDWARINSELEEFSDQYNLPILFTEFGYKSVEGSANGHWQSEENPQPDHQAQAEAYEALFTSVWNQHWFAGGFAWKWHMETPSERKWQTGFTPQKKPAEQKIRQAWSIIK